MAEKFTIKNMFAADDAARQGSLEQARLAAALTKPHILPPGNQSKNDELPKNFQSIGSRGISGLTGKLMLAIYPPGAPWFLLTLPKQVANDPNADPQMVQGVQQQLMIYGQILMSKIESMQVRMNTQQRRRVLGFRAEKVRAIEQILVTGDALERLHPDYRMQLFPRDSYVTKRDGTGEVLYHITKEKMDARALKEGQFEMSGLDRKHIESNNPADRSVELYTWINWEHASSEWVIQQEVNDAVVQTSTEPISPYISTPFELVNEDYGRGFIEAQNLGDLRSLDELELRLLDLLAAAAKLLIGKSPSSMVRDSDLKQPTGSVVPGVQMVGGVAQDVGPISFANIRDFQMLINGVTRKSEQLAKSMLIESETVRQAERVTTVEIQRNVEELQSSLGGVYTSVADEQQIPLLERLIYQYNKDHNFSLTVNGEPLPLEMHSTTGIAALSNSQDIQKLLTAMQVLQQMGPDAVSRIDMGIAVDVLFRQINFHEPGLVKSEEQVQSERQAAIQEQMALQAAQQGIKSTGKIAESGAQAEAQARNQPEPTAA